MAISLSGERRNPCHGDKRDHQGTNKWSLSLDKI